jgi:hypothetical protein
MADKLYIPRCDRGGQAPIAACFDRNANAPDGFQCKSGSMTAYVILTPVACIMFGLTPVRRDSEKALHTGADAGTGTDTDNLARIWPYPQGAGIRASKRRCSGVGGP